MRLDGGVRTRGDDMIVVRGNNLHPGALQTILHEFAEVADKGPDRVDPRFR